MRWGGEVPIRIFALALFFFMSLATSALAQNVATSTPMNNERFAALRSAAEQAAAQGDKEAQKKFRKLKSHNSLKSVPALLAGTLQNHDGQRPEFIEVKREG
jgi:hypothetical protein